MKKIALTFTALLFAGISAFAQETPKEKGNLAFKEGDNIITAGYGWPNLVATFLNAYNPSNDVKISGLGPISLKYERAIAPKIGVGVSVNYADAHATYTDSGYNYKVGRNTTSVLFRLNVHFATTDKLDAYWGIGVGYRGVNWYAKTNDPKYNVDNFLKDINGVTNPLPIGFETTLGLRYYLTPKIGIYTELGLAKAIIQGGIAIKI